MNKLAKQTLITERGEIIRKGWEFYYSFAVEMSAGTDRYNLEYASPIQRETVTGLQIRKKEGNAKSINGNDLVNDDAFLAAFLTLKQRNAEVFENIPVYNVWKATEQGLWFPVNIPMIDMAQSHLFISDVSTVVDDEDFELTFKYLNTIVQKKRA